MPPPRDKKSTPNRLHLVWRGEVPDHAIDIAWSASGHQLAVAAVSGPVRIFESVSGTVQRDYTGHGFGTAAIAYHPTEPILATCGQDGKVRIWDTAFGDEKHCFEGGAAWVERLAWNAEGTILASAAGKKVKLWDYPSGTLRREFSNHASTVADLAWRPQSNALAVAAYGAIAIYAPENPEPTKKFEWRGSALKLSWSPDGKLLAHGNQDSSVHFWYADSGRELHMSGYPSKVRELSWDFTGRFLATGGGDVICVWDCGGNKGPEGSTPKMLEGHNATVSAVAWQRRGFLLASGDGDGRVIAWQPANRTAIIGGATLEGTEISALAWSPDDKFLAVGSGLGAVAVFRVG